VITWPHPSTGFRLMESSSLTPPNWTPVTDSPAHLGEDNQVPVEPAGSNRFFRLQGIDGQSVGPCPCHASGRRATGKAAGSAIHDGATRHRVFRERPVRPRSGHPLVRRLPVRCDGHHRHDSVCRRAPQAPLTVGGAGPIVIRLLASQGSLVGGTVNTILQKVALVISLSGFAVGNAATTFHVAPHPWGRTPLPGRKRDPSPPFKKGIDVATEGTRSSSPGGSTRRTFF